MAAPRFVAQDFKAAPFASPHFHARRFGPRSVDPLAVGGFTVPALIATYGGTHLTRVTAKIPIIAILELGGGYTASDNATAFAGMPKPLIADVSVQGGTNAPGDAADGEVALDIQVAAKAYSSLTGEPASIVMLWAPNTDTGFAAAVAQAGKIGATCLSVSWGAAERQWGSTVAMEAALAANVAVGCANFAAAGDSNSGDGVSGQNCVLPEAMIAGPTMRMAKDVKVGDEVFGHDGRPHGVKRVFRRYVNGNIVRIASSGSVRMEVTEEHPVLVYRWTPRRVPAAVPAVATTHADPDLQTVTRNAKPYKAHWVKASDVRPGDYLATPKIVNQSVGESPLPASDSTAWLLGYYAGNGCVGSNKKISFGVPPRCLKRVYQAVVAMGLKPCVRKLWTNGRGSGVGPPTCYEVAAYDAPLARKFKAWFGHKAPNKRLPEFVFRGWPLGKVLEGLMAADGNRSTTHTINPNVIFNSVSRTLAQQVRLVAISEGHRPTMYKIAPAAEKGWNSAYPNSKEIWRVRWTEGGCQSVVFFSGNMALTPVRSVSFRPYSGEVFNFEVAEVNSYLADTLVSHNCDYPSSSPSVVGCGGTSLMLGGGTYSEKVWNDGRGGGTGGGLSASFARPHFQDAIQGSPRRGVPDVSAVADPNTGYQIFLNGQWGVIGGTSAVAPLYAGVLAAYVASGGSVKDLLARIYALKGTGFTDITIGNNGGYKAGVSYDYCTGLGTPRIAELFAALSGTVVTPPPVPPPPVKRTVTFTVTGDNLTYVVS